MFDEYKTGMALLWDRMLNEVAERPMNPWLAFLIFLIPAIFVWFLVRPGHSLRSRVIGFGWLILSTIIFWN